jgi:hypothetical protein
MHTSANVVLELLYHGEPIAIIDECDLVVLGVGLDVLKAIEADRYLELYDQPQAA